MTVSKWDAEAITYNDDEQLKSILVGRSIVSTLADGEEDSYSRVLSFVLDDGSVLRAHATDGGCACSNGCWSVTNPEQVTGTIMNVESEEVAGEYGESATMRLFVYTELGKGTLVQSEGSDNGYYGWGYYLSVQRPVAAAKDGA